MSPARARSCGPRSSSSYDLGDDHPLDPIRLDLTMRLATELGVLEGVEPLVPEQAPDEEVQRVHVPSYLTAVKSAPEDAVRGRATGSAPTTTRSSSGCTRPARWSAAGRCSPRGRSPRAAPTAPSTSPAGCTTRCADRAAGFCVYNDCAVAISWLLDHGFDRIAYVDVDVHHGDGVQAAFYADPRVLTISLHQHPMTLWPGTGWPGEYGEGAGGGYAVNVPLPPGTADAGWLRAFHAVVPSLLAAFRPQILVTQCGVDTHAEDPLANLGLSVDGHRAIYRALRELADAHRGRQVARRRRRRLRAVPGGAAVVDAPDRHRARPRRRAGPAAARRLGGAHRRAHRPAAADRR